jgi:hypothetical protein
MRAIAALSNMPEYFTSTAATTFFGDHMHSMSDNFNATKR